MRSYRTDHIPVTDNLFLLEAIPKNLVAVSFEPTNSLNVVNGELTFGGTDSSKYIGSITYAYAYSTRIPAAT